MPPVAVYLVRVLLDGLDSGFLDVVRSREVRLAGAEVGDVHTFGFQLFGGIDDRGGGGNLDAVDAVG